MGIRCNATFVISCICKIFFHPNNYFLDLFALHLAVVETKHITTLNLDIASLSRPSRARGEKHKGRGDHAGVAARQTRRLPLLSEPPSSPTIHADLLPHANNPPWTNHSTKNRPAHRLNRKKPNKRFGWLGSL